MQEGEPATALRDHFGTVLVGGFVLAFFATAAVFSLVWLFSVTAHTFGADYQIYLDAYGRARAGLNPYLLYYKEPFVSHPFLLVFVRLLFFKGPMLSKVVWAGLSIAAWVACFFAAVSLVGSHGEELREPGLAQSPPVWLLLAFLLFGPFLETVAIGQVNLLALLFLTASLVLSEDGRSIPAGIALAIAIVLKTSPLIFIAYFLVTKRYRVVLAAVITILVATALSQLPFPGDVVKPFLAIVPTLSRDVDPSPYNLGPLSTAFRLLDVSPPDPRETPVRVISILILAGLAALLFGLGRGRTTPSLRIWFFACLLPLMLLASPLLWYHHLVFLLLPLFLLLQHPSGMLRGVGFFALVLVQLERLFEHYVAAYPWPVLCGIALVLLGCLAAVIELRRASARQDRPLATDPLAKASRF